jgi:ATP-binding cassette subfamily C protein
MENKSSETNKSKNNSENNYLRDVHASFLFRKTAQEKALKKLGSIFSTSSKEPSDYTFSSEKSYDSLLLLTCQHIGKTEKIEFTSGFKNASEDWSPLKKILRASNIRSRKVLLKDQWWTNDYGPLLAFLEDDTPISLKWKKNKYVLHNIKKGETCKVNEDNSKQIQSIAHSFFTPLPDGKLDKKTLIKFILGFTKKDMLFFLILGILGALISLLIPVVAGYIFNVIIPGGIKGSLYEIGLMLFSVVVLLGVINFAREIAVLRFEGKASYKLQSAIWDRILKLKVPFFGKYDAGDLAERSLSIETVRKILSAQVMSAVVAAIFSIFYLILMFYYDITLTILALFLGLIIAVFTLVISAMAIKHIKKFMKLKVVISGYMISILSGIHKIRMTASENRVLEMWADKYHEQKTHYIAKRRLVIIVSVFTFGFPIFATLVIYLRIFELFTMPQLVPFTIGDFIAFNSAYLSFQSALVAAFMVAIPVMSIKPALELLDPILEAETEDYTDKKDVGKLTGDIEISHLNFKYKDSDNLILKDISLSIKEGQFVAIVGGSGSGKSTLLRLLLGFEDYDQGMILYNGLDMKTLDIRTIRDQVGVVLQDGKIMEGSVLYNIVGTSDYTEEEAWEAARIAGCEKDIENLENKMDTILAAGGGILSGGQKQRIVIARALIKKPNLILFDEATSALDNSTQKTVTESLSKLKATKIVIAHRLSTIKDADVIFVLEKGKILEQGNYDKLIKNKSFFYDLVKTQIN